MIDRNLIHLSSDIHLRLTIRKVESSLSLTALKDTGWNVLASCL